MVGTLGGRREMPKTKATFIEPMLLLGTEKLPQGAESHNDGYILAARAKSGPTQIQVGGMSNLQKGTHRVRHRRVLLVDTNHAVGQRFRRHDCLNLVRRKLC